MKGFYFGLLTTLLFISAKGQDWHPLGDGTGLNNEVMEITEYNGKLVAAGRFFQAGGQLSYAVAQWDGSSWSPMNTGFNDEVRALAVFNGELYAAGLFEYDGTLNQAFNRIAKWNGTQWLNVPLPDANTVDIRDLYVMDGELYATNNTWVDNVFVGKIAKFNGNDWTSLPGTFTGPLNYIYLYKLGEYDGKLIVTGIFDEVGGVEAQRVAMFNGTSWESVGFPVSGETPGGILEGRGNAIAEFDGKLWIGGIFVNFEGNPNGIEVASFDGTNWESYPFAENIGNEVMDFEFLDNHLLASGEFGFWEGNQIVTGCVVFDSTAANSWRNLNFYNAASGNSKGKTMALYNGDLFLAGNFSHAGSGTTLLNRIARFDGLLPLGLSDPLNEAQPIAVYPNPATGFVMIPEALLSPEAEAVYHLYGHAGNEITTGSISGGRIDVSGLRPGIYLLKLNIGKDLYMARFVVSW